MSNILCPVCQTVMIHVTYITNTKFLKCSNGLEFKEKHYCTMEINAGWTLGLYLPNGNAIIQFHLPDKYSICLFNMNNIYPILPLNFQDAYTKLKHYLSLKSFL